MGSDLNWYGRQENPDLRRRMTEELVDLCKALGWEHEVLTPDTTFTTFVRSPYEYLERYGKPTAGAEKRPKREYPPYSWYQPTAMVQALYSIFDLDDPLQNKKFEVGLEGVIIHPYGKSPDFDELSFAFLHGEDLPAELRYSIATAEDKGDCSADKIPKIYLRGSTRMGSGAVYGLCRLLGLVKRLWVPDLRFGSDYGEDKQAQRIAEDTGLFVFHGRNALEILRNKGFRDHLDRMTSFHNDAIHLGSYPEFWDRYCAFSERVKSHPLPGMKELEGMMQAKYTPDWRRTGIGALLYTPGSVHEMLKAHNVLDLGTLCESGEVILATYDPAVRESLGIDMRKALWFLADPQSGINGADLVRFLQKEEPPAGKGKQVDERPRPPKSWTKVEWNPNDDYQKLWSEIWSHLQADNPRSLAQLYASLERMELPGHADRAVIWPDGLALSLRSRKALCLYSVWGVSPFLPCSDKMFQVDQGILTETLDDFLETCMPSLYHDKDYLIVSECDAATRALIFRTVGEHHNFALLEHGWQVSEWAKEHDTGWHYWRGLLIQKWSRYFGQGYKWILLKDGR